MGYDAVIASLLDPDSLSLYIYQLHAMPRNCTDFPYAFVLLPMEVEEKIKDGDNIRW